MTTQVKHVDEVTIRFAGDSGDGMQLTGTRFTETTAIAGNDLKTLPDYPAEIRAPAGTLGGVSAFQLMFGSKTVFTSGDAPDVLVAMNPAALKVHLKELVKGGVILANADAFSDKNLKLAGWESNPLEDDSLSSYTLYSVQMTKLVNLALAESGLAPKSIDRTKNMFALGILFWMYNRDPEPTFRWLKEKFSKAPVLAEGNITAIKAGYNYGDITRIFNTSYRVERAEIPKGKYKSVTGNEATAYGLVAAAKKAGKEIFLGSYPITPASEILHTMSKLKNFGVKTFQAEDEIAGITSAIGASFAGDLACTTTSGPGLALKSEAIGLALITELPLVIVNVQRGGPSTGLPTKTEQSDLLQALYGRNGDGEVPVIAASTPSDCFYAAYEASRMAVKYMTPVILLTDGYLGNGSEPWKIPSVDELDDFEISHPKAEDFSEDVKFQPYKRDEVTLARPWAIPGTKGLEHRIGGLEKVDVSGDVSYEPMNHQVMTHLRVDKVAGMTREIPQTEIFGEAKAKLLVLGWGGTFGAIHVGVDRAQQKGYSVSQIHLRWVNPLPADLGDIFKNFDEILIPELNMGQLSKIIRMNFLRDVIQLNKVQGLPFKGSEIETKIYSILDKK
mgnify:CR=1 FL=1|jgi:2-oxoglutarate/2-oxoacid ferredoxin oxidoreductase subunit alpha